MAVLIFYDFPNCRRTLNSFYSSGGSLGSVRPRWKFSIIKKLVALTLPLGFATLLMSLYTNIPRYFIERSLGEYELGIFSSMAYLIILGSRMVQSLANASMPGLARIYFTGYKEKYTAVLCKMILTVGTLGALAVLIASVFGHQLLAILYSPEYARDKQVFVLIVMGGAFQYVATYLSFSLTAARYTHIQMSLSILYVGMLTLCCFLLIPQYKILGAAYAIAIASAVQLLGNGLANVVVIRNMIKLEGSVQGSPP